MSLMVACGAIFTGAFIQMYEVTNAGDAQAAAQQQLSTAYERLDRDLPYASAVSLPGSSAGDWYVEYLLDLNGVPTCVELRLRVSTGQLQRRTWPSGSITAPGAWSALAADVQALTTAGPFTQLPADPTLNYPRLKVTLVATSGTGRTSATRQATSTWAALNALAPNDTVCTSKRSVP